MSQRICIIPDCGQRPIARQLCNKHYQRWRIEGDAFVPARKIPPRKTPDERFWSMIEKTDTCWLWQGHLNHQGYGRFNPRDGRPHMMAHRFAYIMLVADIPASLELDHLCRVRTCVRPDHLEPVTGRENRRRALVAKGTRKRCKSGRHEWIPGVHQCRACASERQRERRAARRNR